MADRSEDREKIFTLVIKRSGKTYQLCCGEDVTKVLSSNSVDGSVKELFINGLIQSQYPDVAAKIKSSTDVQTKNTSEQQMTSQIDNSAMTEREIKNPQNKPTESMNNDFVEEKNYPCSQTIHAWKSGEEDMLVSLRHDRQKDFAMTKNHSQLWCQIAAEINENFNSKLTGIQANYKYNNLKKKWKEVIDSVSSTGAEPKSFRQRDAFDEFYGTKASTRPKFSIDSSKQNKDTPDVSDEEDSAKKDKTIVKKTSTNPKNRKASQISETMERHHEEFKQTMERFHKEKLDRYDRMLDLYEREIDMKRKQ